jgi:hypothetical protein
VHLNYVLFDWRSDKDDVYLFLYANDYVFFLDIETFKKDGTVLQNHFKCFEAACLCF